MKLSGTTNCLLFAALFLSASHSSSCLAGDWPQILGPTRDGIAVDEHLLDRFPAGGPKVVWEREVGMGFAGPAVVDGRLVLFHRVGDEEVVEAIEAAGGKSIWKKSFPVKFQSGYSDDNGPRCAPLIHQGQIYLFGASGNLYCLSLKDGTKRWSREAYKDFGAPEGYFGAGSTPIVEKDKLLVNVGGKAGSGLVAFALKDGKTVWQVTDELASYSSPVAATVDGVRHVIFVARLNAVSVDPENGAVRFRIPFGKRGPTVNGASPVLIGDNMFLTANYGIGALFTHIGQDGAKPLWENDDTLSSQYTTPILDRGLLYGIDGQDGPAATLRCIDPESGKIQWQEANFGMATLMLADGKLLIMKTDGTLVLAAPSAKGFKSLGSARIHDKITRALPALSNGLYFVRNTGTLKCLDLRATK